MALDAEQRMCRFISFFGLLNLILSISMIVIGCINLDFKSDDPVANGTCRIQPHIPVFLIVGGALLLGTVLIRFLLQRYCRKCSEGSDNTFCLSANFACKFSCILVYDVLVFIVFVVWLIIGSIWTLPIYNNVSFSGGGSYCPQFLYLFTFAVIIFFWIVIFFSLFFGLLIKFCDCFFDVICCKPCKRNHV